MADAPVVFKRGKQKHAQRSRVSTPDITSQEEGGSEVAEGEDSPSVLASKLKNKIKARSKPKSTLSFGGDEEVRVSHCTLELRLIGTVAGGGRGGFSAQEIQSEPQIDVE